jgi:hypothetical protein
MARADQFGALIPGTPLSDTVEYEAPSAVKAISHNASSSPASSEKHSPIVTPALSTCFPASCLGPGGKVLLRVLRQHMVHHLGQMRLGLLQRGLCRHPILLAQRLHLPMLDELVRPTHPNHGGLQSKLVQRLQHR